MIKIADISVYDYFHAEDTTQYDVLVTCLKPLNSFAGKKCNVSNLTYNEVEVIKMILRQPTMQNIMDLIILCYDIRGTMKQSAEEIYLLTSVFDLFRAKQYIQNFIILILNREKSWLTGKKDDKLLMINSAQRTKNISQLLTKMMLAEKYSCTPKEVGNWKYSEVFAILVATKTKDDLFKEYNEIK